MLLFHTATATVIPSYYVPELTSLHNCMVMNSCTNMHFTACVILITDNNIEFQWTLLSMVATRCPAHQEMNTIASMEELASQSI